MAEYGFIVHGSSGALQIHDSYANKFVVQRGIITRTGQFINESEIYLPEPITNVFVRPIPLNSMDGGLRVWTTLISYYSGQYQSGADHTDPNIVSAFGAQATTWQLHEGKFTAPESFVAASTVNDGLYEYIAVGNLPEYESFLLARGSTVRTPGVGLEINRADGLPLFRSTVEILKIAARLEVPASAPNLSYSYPLPAPTHKYWVDVTQLDTYSKCAFASETEILINVGKAFDGNLAGTYSGTTLPRSILIADMP